MSISKATMWRRNNPEKWKAQRAEYKERRNILRRAQYAELTTAQRTTLAAERRARRKNDPRATQKDRERQRLTVLRACGMSLAEARIWYTKVTKKCRICGTRTRLGIDHDHVKKQVRGILCRNCNLGLGHLKDNVKLVTQALAYLSEYNK